MKMKHKSGKIQGMPNMVPTNSRCTCQTPFIVRLRVSLRSRACLGREFLRPEAARIAAFKL